MRPVRIVLPALLALAAAWAAPVEAQTIPSPYRFIEKGQAVEPWVGYLFTDPTVALNADSVGEFGPQSAPIIGARYRGRLTGPLTGEVIVGFSPSERKVIDPVFNDDSTVVRARPTGETASLPLLVVEAGMRLQLTGARTWRGFAPYVGGSGGVVTWLKGHTSAELNQFENEQFDFGPGFALGLRAGTDWFVSPRVAVNAEVSDRLWKLSTPLAYRIGNDPVESEWTHNLGVSVGAAVHF